MEAGRKHGEGRPGLGGGKKEGRGNLGRAGDRWTDGGTVHVCMLLRSAKCQYFPHPPRPTFSHCIASLPFLEQPIPFNDNLFAKTWDFGSDLLHQDMGRGVKVFSTRPEINSSFFLPLLRNFSFENNVFTTGASPPTKPITEFDFSSSCVRRQTLYIIYALCSAQKRLL